MTTFRTSFLDTVDDDADPLRLVPYKKSNKHAIESLWRVSGIVHCRFLADLAIDAYSN